MFDTLEGPVGASTSEVAPEDLIEELEATLIRRDQISARAAELVARINETRAFQRDGYSSPTALLKHRMSMHPGAARSLVHRANVLARTPRSTAALTEGTISEAQFDALVDAYGVAPEAFISDEKDLIELARTNPLVSDLRKVLDYWASEKAPDDQAFVRDAERYLRSLNLTRVRDRMKIHGWLDIEAGERLRAQLDPGPPAPNETRTAAARRADQLVDIVNGGSARPSLIVHVSAQTLSGSQEGISETSTGTHLTVDEISRLACDSELTRVLMEGDSKVLDLGRTKRLVTPALRVAVSARDLRCVFPGCDRPSNWCDVHHIIHWVHGGCTDLENLTLLCRHHHTLVHESGWTIKGKPGDLTFHRPDGSALPRHPVPRPPSPPPFVVYNPRAGTRTLMTTRQVHRIMRN